MFLAKTITIDSGNNTFKYMYVYSYCMKLTMIAEIWNAGTSSVVTIPKAFIKGGMLNVGSKYRITIEEDLEDGK